MHYTKIKVADQKTVHDCYEAIAKIESDYQNYSVTLSQWNKCADTTNKLLESARLKINALDKKAEKIVDKITMPLGG